MNERPPRRYIYINTGFSSVWTERKNVAAQIQNIDKRIMSPRGQSGIKNQRSVIKRTLISVNKVWNRNISKKIFSFQEKVSIYPIPIIYGQIIMSEWRKRIFSFDQKIENKKP